MIENLKEHYSKLFEQNGISPAAVQHSSELGQFKRFEILTAALPKTASIIDLGCGLGDMLTYLRKNHYTGNFLGLDFMPEFISTAEQRFTNDEQAKFQEFDILNEDIPEGYEYILLSGVFNNNIEDIESFMQTTLIKMFKACGKGMAFNSLSTYVDYQDEDLYYSDPLEVFDFCKKNLSPLVTLKHDYITHEGAFPYEYTMFVNRVSK